MRGENHRSCKAGGITLHLDHADNGNLPSEWHNVKATLAEFMEAK